jgi:CubicO group peptidase (beta-lactamase class C family)
VAPLAVFVGPLAADPSDVGVSAERLARIAPVLQSYVDGGRVAGSVVWVQRQGEDLLLQAFGYRDREKQDPMQTDTIFRIASMTKPIVTAAVMILQENGKLLLADPVSRYLPEFQKTRVAVAREGGYDVVDAKREITIRDLLTHTSGVGYGDGIAKDQWAAAGIQGWYFAGRDEPIRETVRKIAPLPFDAQPGERFVYGYGLDVVGALIEVVSGMPLDAFLREQIFDPFDMRDTYFFLPKAKRNRLAAVYAAAADGKLVRAPDGDGMDRQGLYVDGPRKSFSGGAGLLSTARDYGRFLQALLSGGALGDVRILSPSSVDLMTANHLGNIAFQPGSTFGLGFSVVTDVGARGTPGSVGEYGWGGAYRTVFWVDPEKALIVLYLTQICPSADSPASNLDDAQKLRVLVYQAITGD